MPSQALKLFYKGNKLSTVHTTGAHHSVISANNQNLYETNSQTAQTRLLATDIQESTIIIKSEYQSIIAYSPYGNDSFPADSLLLSRFTGQILLPLLTKSYLLGNGHRLFNTGLMRFHSPDSLSPFDEGGLNGYAYCGNDSINRSDPTGQSFIFNFKRLRGGYSYAKLSKRLALDEPNLSTREYKALKKSIKKRFDMNPTNKEYAAQQRKINSLRLLEVTGKKDRYYNPEAFMSLVNPSYPPSATSTLSATGTLGTLSTTGTLSPTGTLRDRRGSSDSMTSEQWADIERRFAAIQICHMPADGRPWTLPRTGSAADHIYIYSGNAVNDEIYKIRGSFERPLSQG